MKYALILWDFDGTLADTFDGAIRIYNRLAGKHGFLPVRDVETARTLGTRAFLKQHRISLLQVPRLAREFLVAQRAEIESVRLFPGIADALRLIHQRGGRMGILSSNAKENIQACLRANGALACFEFVHGYARLLGKARAIRRLLRRHGLDARRLLYVGDEVRDVEAAHQAGVDIAAVTWGFQLAHQLAARSPTFLVASPEELTRLAIGLGPWSPRFHAPG